MKVSAAWGQTGMGCVHFLDMGRGRLWAGVYFFDMAIFLTWLSF